MIGRVYRDVEVYGDIVVYVSCGCVWLFRIYDVGLYGAYSTSYRSIRKIAGYKGVGYVGGVDINLGVVISTK